MTLEQVLPVMAGGLIGAGGAIVTQWLTHRWSIGRKRRAIAGAFAGEIGAICSIARRRGYLDKAHEILTAVRKTRQPARLVVPITQEYLTIYHSNADVIGLLPPDLPLGVVQFYTQIKALMEHVRPDAPEPIDAAEAEDRLTEQITLLGETLQLGDDLVSGLRGVAE